MRSGRSQQRECGLRLVLPQTSQRNAGPAPGQEVPGQPAPVGERESRGLALRGVQRREERSRGGCHRCRLRTRGRRGLQQHRDKRDDKQIEAARDTQLREHGWQSQEREKDRQFRREERTRREQLYQQHINRQREGRLAWEQRRGAALRSAAGVLPGLHGLPSGFTMNPMIADAAARVAPGSPLTTPITLPAAPAVQTTGQAMYGPGVPGVPGAAAGPVWERGVGPRPGPNTQTYTEKDGRTAVPRTVMPRTVMPNAMPAQGVQGAAQPVAAQPVQMPPANLQTLAPLASGGVPMMTADGQVIPLDAITGRLRRMA